MSGDDSSSENGIELSRRTFTKAAGAAAGAGLLGASANSASAGHSELALSDLANSRVQELVKVWDRGYRGNPNRSIGLTDSGLDARHPDLGPWNGVRGIVGDDGLQLVDESVRDINTPDEPLSDAVSTPGAFPATAQATPGTFATGQEVEVVRFTMNTGPMRYVNAELDWTPSQQNANDLEFRLDKNTGTPDNPTWKPVTTTATGSVPERILGAKVEEETEYRFVAELYVNTVSEATVYVRSSESPNSNPGENAEADETLGFYTKEGPRGALGDSENVMEDYRDGDTKTVGWVDPTGRFGKLSKPRDPDGHGSHVSSIMGGSGRASTVKDVTKHVENESAEALLSGMAKVEYVDVQSGEGVFASAYGDNLEIKIKDPRGEVVAESAVGSDTSEFDNNVVTYPAEKAGTYTVRIQPGSPSASASVGGQSVGNQTLPEESVEVDPDDQLGGASPTIGRVKEFAVGSLESVANAGDGDRTEDGRVAIHSGVAPDASLVGLQGFGAPVEVLANHGDTFTSQFNLRSVNMSWGYVGGLPLGGFGQGLDGGVVENVKEMAEQGIMTVAAAGNAATPANGNGAPAVADEAVSVVATGPRDGIVAYSSGGLGGNDEDGEGAYMKPDVTAPGGSLTDLAQAAKANTSDFSDDETPRDYTGKAGTSMASPFVNGVAGLVADAMEDGDAFDEGDDGLLPAPEDTTFDDVMRWKQVILATASETAFTAAPYHRAKAPSYQYGDRDPFEGYGRVNPDAAIDAVTQNMYGGGASLTDDKFEPGEEVSTNYSGEVGLDVPKDSRAVAGFIEAPRGSLDLRVGAGELEGPDAGMAAGGPHVDVFVYDAENPAANGEPNVVAKTQIRNGSASQLTVYTDGRSQSPQEQADSAVGTLDAASGDGETRKLLVVAKLVNVPGLVNGFDARTTVSFAPNFTLEKLPTFGAVGSRADETQTYIGGSTVDMRVTLDDVTELSDGDTIKVRDSLPEGWTPIVEGPGDAEDFTTENGRVIVDLGEYDADLVNDDGESREFYYQVEVQESGGQATLGPAAVEIDAPESKGVRNDRATFGGTNENAVTPSASSATSTTTETASDPTSATDPISDATGGSGGGSSGGSDGGSITDTVSGTTDTVSDTL
ncbi:S8 family serine peptidase [Haloglomus halophilum]|uniref:S8 family serine peptidase n=1 Tax=Haloglomus halophilum TaxID=2962672 RepID=UPI0020C972F9|nr:S8 family serine peptidase [Haloglomus halophilum]